MSLDAKKIILGITGSISAYKSCNLVRELKRLGADVHVVMTDNAKKFVGELTFQALSENIVNQEDHVILARSADLFLVAPASANILGKMANGIADDLVSTTFLTVQCPTFVCPAMHSQMWQHPAVQANVAKLKSMDIRFIGPVYGDLASGDSGEGRFVDIEEIVFNVESALTMKDLSGMEVLLTVGPTYEPIDDVRYLSNWSSGKLGIAIAKELFMRGASVQVISSLSKDKFVSGVDYYEARTASDMYDQVHALIDDVDVFISAAAVADFSPKLVSEKKLNKSHVSSLNLELNKDILKSLSKIKGDKFFVGFSLDSQLNEGNALLKKSEKLMDLCISVSTEAFGADRMHGAIYARDSSKEDFSCAKTDLARKIADMIAGR